MNPKQIRVFRFLVFHGGSGSSKEEINTAVGHGVVKMNVDTDTQYAYTVGMRASISLGTPFCVRLTRVFPQT